MVDKVYTPAERQKHRKQMERIWEEDSCYRPLRGSTWIINHGDVTGIHFGSSPINRNRYNE